LASAREDQDQHLRSLRDTLERLTQPVGVSRQNEQAQACGCPKPMQMSCDVLIFVEEAADAVVSLDLAYLGQRAEGEWP
jgi:hypothetical protein